MTKPGARNAEGRAVLARPSACLPLIAAVLLVWAFAAPAAHAEKPELLVLTKTSPSSDQSSPANSTTPLIFGVEDSVITSAIGSSLGRLPTTAASNPSNGVTVYANSTCTGTPVASGTLGQLENGIEVEVLPDSVTTFYATQTESGEPTPSDCPTSGLAYWESSTLITPPNEPPPSGPAGPGNLLGPSEPAAPGGPGGAAPHAPHLRTVPFGRANDNTPLITGDAPDSGTVRVFSNSNCKGAPVASGSAAEFVAGLQAQVADDTTTTFSGLLVSGASQSSCSTPITYIEDSTAPRTRITMGPGVKTRKRKTVFRFADIAEDAPGTTFLCKVNRRKWKQCRSPLKLRHLRVHAYVLQVKATDSVGNVETKGVKRRFEVIRGL
jgi:hypothetical protein